MDVTSEGVEDVYGSPEETGLDKFHDKGSGGLSIRDIDGVSTKEREVP